MAKNYVCSAWYLRNHASHDCHCRAEEENNIISWHFFYFFKILTFWVVKMVRGQKMTHKMAYTIWSCFLLHKFNIMTSPDAFFIFSKFWFSSFWYTWVKWWYLQLFFFHVLKILIFLVFQSSTINAKRKFWGVSHLHMCVIFFQKQCFDCFSVITQLALLTLGCNQLFGLHQFCPKKWGWSAGRKKKVWIFWKKSIHIARPFSNKFF